MDKEKISAIIKKGSGITGASIGAGIGFMAGGPLLAAAAGGIGVAVEHALSEVANRILSNREQARVGATAQTAIFHIKLLQDLGKKVRDDDFFDGERSSAEEVFEGCLLAAKNSHEEKKSIYLGYLFANISFREDVDKHQANRLISVANQLTYGQLCLLSILSNKEEYSLKKGNFRNVKLTFKQVVVIQEIFAMENSGLIICEGQHTPGLTDVNPSIVRVQGIGLALYDLMFLKIIPKEDRDELAAHISA